jgi:DNA-directed RNA polymerase subunit H (RpoH/RPB5)
MKHTFIIFAFIMFHIANASAGPPNPIQADILARAQGAKAGAIVAVTDRGEVAADTAWLLSAQVKRDSSYAPLLVVLKPDDRESTLKALNLVDASLPAIIYYDRHGREISRVIGALPSRLIKQVRSSSSGNDAL